MEWFRFFFLCDFKHFFQNVSFVLYGLTSENLSVQCAVQLTRWRHANGRASLTDETRHVIACRTNLDLVISNAILGHTSYMQTLPSVMLTFLADFFSHNVLRLWMLGKTRTPK